MRRREFIAALGGAAAWPLAADAQQQPVMPVVGFLRSTSLAPFQSLVPAFRQALALQLLYRKGSESMGDHDLEIVDAGSVD